MSDWVTAWLGELGLDQYAETFAANAISRQTLPEITDADLKELGVQALGHRKILLKAIDALSVKLDPASAADRHAAPSDSGLATWERHPGERKPVTMLFADITSSTALTENLDAEETHDLLYGATQRMCAAVEAHRGPVSHSIPRGVSAFSTSPALNEGDVARPAPCRPACPVRRATPP